MRYRMALIGALLVAEGLAACNEVGHHASGVTELAPGETCANGGYVVAVTETPVTICNTVAGSDAKAGANGKSGSGGDDGDMGGPGSTGSDGQDGTTGTTGLTGSDGQDGATGATGPKGTSGPAGPSSPVIHAIWSSDVPTQPGAMLQVSVAATVADGANLDYTWSGLDGWVVTGGQGTANATLQAPVDYAVEGSVRVVVAANELTAVAVLPLATVGNAAPTINWASIWPQPIWHTSIFTATANDDHDENLTYSWKLAGTTVATGASTTWTHPGIPAEYEVHLRVADSGNLAVTARLENVQLKSTSPWPTFGRDAQRTSKTDAFGTVTGSVKWSYSTAGSIVASPVVDATGTVYVGSVDGMFYALRITDGSLKWSYDTGNQIHGAATIGSNGIIYFGSLSGKLYALHATDGNQLWTISPGFSQTSTIVGANGMVYISTRNPDRLHAVDGMNGSIEWWYATGNDNYSSPVIGSDGGIFFGSHDNKLHAVNPDGSSKWTYTTGGAITSSPTVGQDGTVYVGSFDNTFYALDATDGSMKWSRTTGGAVVSSAAIGADGTIYVGSRDQKLYALTSEGDLVWTYSTGGWITSRPSIGGDGTIYVGAYDDKLHAINPDGSLKWSYETGGNVSSSPAIGVDGTIYIGSDDGNLYAIE